MIEKDKEVLQIEEKYKDEFDALYDRIHVEVEQNIAKQAQLRKRRQQLSVRLSSIAVALVLVVTLSIVLPIVLQQPEETILRYNDTNIQSELVEYTLQQYAQDIEENILYLDWYNTADEWNTRRYYDANDIEITVYMQEFFYYEGYSVELSVLKTDDKIIVETLEAEWEDSEQTTINDITVAYLAYLRSCNVKFEYQGYTYYLNFMDTSDWDFITFTIESMFNN